MSKLGYSVFRTGLHVTRDGGGVGAGASGGLYVVCLRAYDLANRVVSHRSTIS